MTYKVNIANNLRALLPGLSQHLTVESTRSLNIYEIATKAGVPHILVVGGIIEGRLHPLDQLVEKETEILLLGPVAGG